MLEYVKVLFQAATKSMHSTIHLYCLLKPLSA